MRSLNWKSKLEEALERDKAKCDKININIRREDKITFTCNCGNTHNADVRRICQTTGAFCKICTKKISDNKRSETNMKKYGSKTNLQNISNESEIKRKEKLKDHFNKENNKDKICNNCGNMYNSSSPKSTTCRKCQQVKNVNKRKEKKSKSIKESILQLKTKYPEITDSQLLIDKFNNQDRKCFWCNCKLDCPKLDNSFESNYNKPSLDRIDNDNKLHRIDNVNITCHMCNIMRGGTNYEIFKIIIKILNGESEILDLTNHNFINKLSDKRFTIDYKRVKERINPDNLKLLFCPISNFPIYLGLAKFHPFLPSFDRIFNNDEDGNKLGHNDENIQMVCAFINRGRNEINHSEDFIRIFNEKFPNRCKDIKVIYPDSYDYILKHGCFVNKKYAESNLWKGGASGREMTKYQLFKNRVRRVISHINQIKIIKEWYVKNNRLPKHNNDINEKLIYRNLSSLKNYKIYNNLLSEFLDDIKTQKEKHNDEWYEMYNKLLNYIGINGNLPINTCEDKKLWNWVYTQRKKFKNETLKQDYIDKLEGIEPWWWTEIHQGYLRNKQWFINNPNIIPPKKDFCKTEFNWYSKIKKYYLLPEDDKKCLTNYEIKLIKNIPIIQEWINYECPIKKTDKNYKEFYNQFKHPESIIPRDNKGRIIKK